MSVPPVLIEKLAFGGSGVCRINGKVCFVPFSCPGDEVRLSITSEKRSFCTAEISELVVASPSRVVPPCPLFGRCGGCFWQHIEYPRQLAAKQQILAETFWRGARVEGDRIAPACPSADQYGYRSRVQFKLQLAAGRLQIGFFRHGTHQVADMPSEGCPVAAPLVNQVLKRLREVLGRFREIQAVTAVKVECTGHQVVTIITYTGRDRRAAERFFRENRHQLQPVTGLYLQHAASGSLLKVFGDDELFYDLPAEEQGGEPWRLGYVPGGFAQVNLSQNAALLALIRRMGHFRAEEQILDLFCGNGNFSIPISSRVARVTGVEESRISIEAAKNNCRINGIGNCEFICADASAAVRQWAGSGRRFDTVIMDPPRSGASAALADVCRLQPDNIIYVSCDPSTLARDCSLLSAGGYDAVESVPVDMFPQTFHIESVTLLRRR